jgi:hypothetical protein
MTVSQTPSCFAERRLAIARRLCQALVAQDPDPVITLCDGSGRLVARYNPRPEQVARRLPHGDARKTEVPTGALE